MPLAPLLKAHLTHGITAWFGSQSVHLKSQLPSIISNLMCTENNRFHIPHDPIQEIYLIDIKYDSQSRLFMIPNMYYIMNC